MGYYRLTVHINDSRLLQTLFTEFEDVEISDISDGQVTILIPDGQPDRPKMPWLTVSDSIDRMCGLLLDMHGDDPPDEDDASYLRDQIVHMLDGQVAGCDQPMMLRYMIKGHINRERRGAEQWEHDTADSHRRIREKIVSIIDDIRSGRI